MVDREREFSLVMERGVRSLEREIGYRPTRWLQMVASHGAVAAANRLMATGTDVSSGLSKLAMHHRLDQSVEWFVLVYDDLFTPDERLTAYRRLRLHEAPVDDWLRNRLGRTWV